MDEMPKNFLGTGWKFPIEFDPNTGSVVMLSGEEDIRNSLAVLFSTSVGERIMHANYGSALSSFLFMPLNRSTLTYMQAIISDEILFNEPRIVLDEVDIVQSPGEPGRLDIVLSYRVSATNNRYNYTYPFYISEANNLVR